MTRADCLFFQMLVMLCAILVLRTAALAQERDVPGKPIGKVSVTENLILMELDQSALGQQNLFESQAVHDLANQIKTFLRGKARNDADHRRAFVGLAKSETRQQIPLAFGFSAEVICRVVGGNESIRPRVPLLVINSIQNPRHRLRAFL